MVTRSRHETVIFLIIEGSVGVPLCRRYDLLRVRRYTSPVYFLLVPGTIEFSVAPPTINQSLSVNLPGVWRVQEKTETRDLVQEREVLIKKESTNDTVRTSKSKNSGEVLSTRIFVG